MFVLILPLFAFISGLFKSLVFPIIPYTVYGVIAMIIITFCIGVAGTGGTVIFYIVLALYMRLLFTYNPTKATEDANN